ncbi:MAG: hypothetical protein L3J65_02115 [Robiginitomaculum sp.]|nr:hypothetical protein [Robiginitomaculum sp.]
MVRIFNGVVNALNGKPWEDGFDLSPRGLPRSFIAVAAYIPLGLIAARAAVKYNDNTASMPYGPIVITLGLIALTFPLIAYVLCMLFDKMDRFRPWVIVRNWTFLFAYALIAASLGLYLLGMLPFFPAYVVALTLYICTLAIDVRLAWRIAGFDWMGAVFAGILISAATMMVLSLVISQNIT